MGRDCLVIDSWQVRHFSQSNPVGEGQGDVAALLRRAAASIEELEEAQVQDIVVNLEIDDDGRPRPSVTVYFHHSGDR